MLGRLQRLVGATGLLLALPLGALAQTAPQRVTGQEIESWFAADQMSVAGISLANGCHWITNGPKERRNQSVHCLNHAPFTVVGEARVEGDRLCSKFVYPDGSRLEACQEVFRIGDNKYETRIGGGARGVFYRLLR
jgi:hypothetical protein